MYHVVIPDPDGILMHGIVADECDKLHALRNYLIKREYLGQKLSEKKFRDSLNAFFPVLEYIHGIHGELLIENIGEVETHRIFKFIFYFKPQGKE